jgi:diguanylate cyclase
MRCINYKTYRGVMHYHQTRENSAEILRIALAHMGRQQAAFHPGSYALWYEHAGGLNPPLSAELDQRIGANLTLTEADVWQLYAQFIVSRDNEALGEIQQRLTTLLRETSEVVSSTGTHALRFGEHLDDHSTRLKEPASLEHIQGIVKELLAQTQHMCLTNATLSRQLDTSAQEVLRLTHRLQSTQSEALNDPLTGLLNRRGFERAVERLIAQSGGMGGASLVAADVDHFKCINDSHGHMAGDQVLRAVGQILRARTKGADIAARLGGDEFVILLPSTPISGALALAEQIRTTLYKCRLRRVDRDEYIEKITLSLGVALAKPGEPLEELLHRADTALYGAKRAGRDRVAAANGAPPG